MAPTIAEPTRLLDLTRLVSRAGQVQTGVDRVEYAYLARLLEGAAPLFGLVRTSLGFVLLDRAGCAGLKARLDGGGWGPADRLARIKPKLDPMRARAEADLRRICLDRCLAVRLSRMLARHLPEGVHYINTGHTNLTERVLSALRLRKARVAVMVHDAIPLDFPHFQRPGTVEPFRGFLRRAGALSDLVICNSQHTRNRLAAHLDPLGLTPETVVAPLGVTPPVAGPPPDGPWTGKTWFVTLGTIEPRKNHALLLDLWDEVPDAHLLVIGNRGWNNAAVFAALDRGHPRIHELTGLPDMDVFGLLRESAGLLHPSLAEGYGFPPAEAAALEVPVLCNDLEVYREIVGDIPVYADVSDRYLWLTTIKRLVDDHREGRKSGTAPRFRAPGWDAHFNTVLTLI
ncbi:glycosyltransferase family 4 protein [Thalassococcus sp. CAU 1522]|uniref:Glycosyltransferase family 4 protein n=1 Tax=Thalassococcus arenae TaxID=2851652 RepID=A0ABS6N6I2_9RHOB|nr:glycosyltransferase family 1 protein [Thalassococcus arenae]MBV2359626.1 glycosyltransferase family 4 protein [Thalassococcus arenae]